MARTIVSASTALLASCACSFVHAQSEPRSTASVAQEKPEEIVVRGNRSLFAMRRELQDARERVWDIFNELNSSDDFDIACADAARTGSRIQRRACRPQYANSGTARAGKELARRIKLCDPTAAPEIYAPCLEQAMRAASAEGAASIGVIASMDQKLDDEFRNLAAQHPELASAIVDYQTKEQEYQEEVRARSD